jgi:hypothetical protein
MHVNKAVASFVLFAVLSSCCRDHVIQEQRSPSGQKVATVSYRDCGVLSDGTAVLLRSARWSRAKVVVSAEGHHVFSAFWEDEHTLRVYVPETARAGGFANPQIVQQHEEVDGTHIEYSR